MITTKLPERLHAAYEWVDAAGDIEALQMFSEADARTYADEAAENAMHDGSSGAVTSAAVFELWLYLRPVLLEQFEKSEHELYGRWEIYGVGEVGCMIGVPQQHRASAKGAASDRGYITAWYADASDWSTPEERDAALEVMQAHAVALWERLSQ